MIILSQHLFPRDSESPAVPPKISHFGGTAKKIFGANAPTPSLQNLHQVSTNAFLYTVLIKTLNSRGALMLLYCVACSAMDTHPRYQI